MRSWQRRFLVRIVSVGVGVVFLMIATWLRVEGACHEKREVAIARGSRSTVSLEPCSNWPNPRDCFLPNVYSFPVTQFDFT